MGDPEESDPESGKTSPRRADRGEVSDVGEDLPVVARIVVEIRSDGTRTIARGALDDRLAEQQVALQIDVGSPLSLAKSLAKAIFAAPSLARASWGRRRKRRALRSNDDD